MKYFDKFPLVNYDGSPAKNILARVNFTPASMKSIHSQFDYSLSDFLVRPDLISSTYYNDSNYDWTIYLSNGIIDPYDIFMTQKDLESIMTSKYGSISNAQRLILFYRNDWAADESTITPTLYDTLNVDIKKYYSPLINNTNQIIGFNRSKQDWIRSTNQIIQLKIVDSSSFSIGDTYIQDKARATVLQNDKTNNILTLQHVFNTFVVDATILSINIIQRVIPDVEIPFWSPVTAYDKMMEDNERKRHISLIKSSYISDIEQKFNAAIKE